MSPDPLAPVMPVSRSLFLCEAHIGYSDARVDLYGIFNVLRPASYPHSLPYLVVFAQLTGGVGDVPFFLEVRRERDDALIRATAIHSLHFPDRTVSVPLAFTLQGVQFPDPDVYVVSLFCHNTWVCDTVVSLE